MEGPLEFPLEYYDTNNKKVKSTCAQTGRLVSSTRRL